MCIICNVPNSAEADAFLSAYRRAQVAMREAEKFMLDVVAQAPPEHRARYSATHKRLVRARKNWNQTEHFREDVGTPLRPETLERIARGMAKINGMEG